MPLTTACEVVWLSRTELGRCLKVGFEVVGRTVTERGLSALSVVIGDMVADFEFGFGQVQLAPTLPRQVRNVADPYLVGGSGGRLAQ